MRYLLDTNCCIHLFTGAHPALTARVATQVADSLVISVITYCEIALGTQAGRPPIQRQLDAFVKEVPVMPFEQSAAEIYACLPFRRGSFDRLIAAHALALGLPLVTHNVSDFADIPGLTVENWTLP